MNSSAFLIMAIPAGVAVSGGVLAAVWKPSHQVRSLIQPFVPMAEVFAAYEAASRDRSITHRRNTRATEYVNGRLQEEPIETRPVRWLLGSTAKRCFERVFFWLEHGNTRVRD